MKKINAITIASIAVLSIAGFAFSAIPTQAEETEEHEEHFQLTQDIGDREFKQGQFLLLADWGHHEIEEAHVAVVVDCSKNGNSSLDLVYGHVLKDSEGETNLSIVELNNDNIVSDLSSPGSLCVYHVNIEPSETVPEITDFALINQDKKTVKTSNLAIATIHVDVEIEEHEE